MERPPVGKIHISFDDANETDYTKAFPILNEHGYRATSFINPQNIGNREKLSLEQLSALDDAGWDISSHTWGHLHLPELDETEQRRQLVKSKTWLSEHGFEEGAEFFSYPFGEYDQTTLDLVDRLHTLAFSGGYPPFASVANPMVVPRSSGDISADAARRIIQLAAKYRGITTIFYHNLSNELVEEFEETISYLHTLESNGTIEVITSRELVS